MTFTAAQNAVHSIFGAGGVGARLAAAREGRRLPQDAHRPHSAAEQGVRVPAHMLLRECLCKLHQQRFLMCCDLGCITSKLGTSQLVMFCSEGAKCVGCELAHGNSQKGAF